MSAAVVFPAGAREQTSRTDPGAAAFIRSGQGNACRINGSGDIRQAATATSPWDYLAICTTPSPGSPACERLPEPLTAISSRTKERNCIDGKAF
jgi:hypothetical protein